MRKFVIERDIPAVGTLEREQLRDALEKSTEALRALAPDIQWVHTYIAADKTFCIYLATDERLIREHARRAGLPVACVTEIGKVVDPTTARA